MNKSIKKNFISIQKISLLSILFFVTNSHAQNENLILNNSFEEGFSHWQEVEPVAQSDHARLGRASAKLSKSGAKISQWVVVKPNTDYLLSAFVKGSGRIGVEVNSNTHEQTIRDRSSWSKVNVAFNSGDSTSALVYANYYLDLSRVDDFSLTQASVLIEQSQAVTSEAGLGFSLECPSNGEIMIQSVYDDGSNDGNLPGKTIDGDLTNRWSSKGINRFITFDLGQAVDLKDLQIKWFKGGSRVYVFSVQTSNDGENWQDVLMETSSQSLDGFESHNIESILNPGARYVKLIGRGNTDNQWNAIMEVKLTGCYQ